MPRFTLAADWTNIGFPDKNIKTVFVDPKNNQHIIVSLGSYQDNNYNHYTENGGSSWTPVNMGGAMTQCNNFARNPKTPSEIWAGCAVGLFRSVDGGKSFTVIPNYKYTQLVNVSISASGVIYITSMGNNLHRSVDGVVWEALRPPSNNNQPVIFLNNHSANEIYLSVSGGTSPGLYKSIDLGATFALINNQQQIRSGVAQMTFEASGKICASVSTSGIGCSTDGGFTWSAFVSPNLAKPVEYQHFYQLVQNPDDESNLLVLAGTWGGLDTKIYNYKSGSAIPEELVVAQSTSNITISQGVVYAWAQNAGWTKGLWRNDGIAVVPEYLKKHPVIIVPGILGSWSTAPVGDWDFEPIFNTYTELYNQFLLAGFEPGKTLFKFPYQWRSDNRETAYLLKQKIDEAKSMSGATKVDIVAHSMGGIVTRIYAQSDSYQNDIDQITFVGAPQIGSVNSYPMWEGADLSNNDLMSRVVLWAILREEAWQFGYSKNEILNYIRNNVPSIQQLLPIYSYINGRTYPEGYPRNELLESLEDSKGRLELRGIRITNIVGNNVPTMSNIEVLNGDFGIYWPNGKAMSYGLDSGDGTVTLASQVAVPGEVIIKDKVIHRDLPKFSINEIFRSLGIDYVSTKTIEAINKYLFIAAYSPIDFQVIAPDGKKTGFNKDGIMFNEINGAFYTGNNTETEFLTIPNPQSGEYKVMTYGTGTGSYEIEATYADSENNTSVSSSYYGQATPGKEDKLLVEFAPDTHKLETKIDDRIAPVTSASLVGSEINGFYNSDVTFSLTALDIESGVQKIEYSEDGILWLNYTAQLSFTTDGETTISYRSVDKTGNVESAQTITFKIDKTPPVASVNFDKPTLTHWDSLTLWCEAKDNYSEISEFVVKLDGVALNCNQSVKLWGQSLGDHRLEYMVRDKAGNVTSGETSYRVVANYKSTVLDIWWLYENKHFKSRGDAVNLIAQVQVSSLLNSFSMRRISVEILNQVLSTLDKQLAKGKLSAVGYDMINKDIKYILEEK